MTDAYDMIGSTNSTWFPCILEGASVAASIKVMQEVRNVGQNNFYVQYQLPLPTSRGGKKLYLDKVKILLSAADDEDDYLNMIKVFGQKMNQLTLFYENHGDWISQQAVECDISPNKDASGDDVINVLLHVIADDSEEVKIAGVMLKVYYD